MSATTDYLNLAEYGNWLYGYIPTGEVTAIIYYKGRFIDSYIEEHTEYDETPLKGAFEAYVNQNSLHVESGSYWNHEVGKEFNHDSGKLVSALVGIPQTSKVYKAGFKRKVSEGKIHFPCPVLVNRYGDVYAHEDYAGEVREMFMDYVHEKHE